MTQNNRRQFLKTAGVVSLGSVFSTQSSRANLIEANPADSGKSGITRETFAEAEKLTGVPYSDNERDMMLGTIEQQIRWAKQVRSQDIKNADAAPASVFDPRLADTQLPKANWKRQGTTNKALPSNNIDIAFAPITSLSEWIRTGKLKSRDLTEIYLSRLKKHANELDCMVTITGQLARQQADQADKEIARGKYRGPLHGIPYGAKDLFDTKGIRTTWGATPYKDRVAEADASVIEKLREAGAVLLGKTTLGALAYGDLWFDGVTRNPWNTEEGSGGSSAGSGSAVAAGLMPFALGTETLGSIEFPASRNGVVGLRPTFGRVSRHGAMVLCWSLDKVGALCRSAEDSMLVLNAINGHDSRDVGSIDAALAFDNASPVAGTRVGYDPEWFSGDLPDFIRTMPRLLKRMGLELVEIKLPNLPYRSMISILTTEAGAAFDDLLLAGGEDSLRAQTPRAWPNTLRQARFVSAIDLIQTQRFRRQVMELVHKQFTGIDIMIGPGISGPGQGTIMSVISNFTGHPSLTIRAGFIRSAARRGGFVEPKFFGAPASGKEREVPVPITLWGPLFEEGKLCRIGMALEKQLGVHEARPALFS